MKAGWKDEWINAAENIVRAEYKRENANQAVGNIDDENNETRLSPKK